MRYTVICSDERHPVYRELMRWKQSSPVGDEISIVQKSSDIGWSGRYLFLVACSEMIKPAVRQRFEETIVFHAGDVPTGRGWSPHLWEIEAGARHITLTMMRAADRVDAGDVFEKRRIEIPQTALYGEISARLFDAQFQMLDAAVLSGQLPQATPQPSTVEPTYYPRRRPNDSVIDAERPIADQFDRIRVCDPDRFPPLVVIRGRRFKLLLQEASDE